MGVFEKIFGTRSQREIKKIQPTVDKILALEDEYKALSEEALKAKTAEFKNRLDQGQTLDDLLPEAFAAVREAADRVLGMRPYPVQLIGGVVLHQGRIAEMKTGEGKTLVAILPCYLNALTGKGVHVVTVNEYLAKRDSEWMGKVYRYMGLSVGLVIPGMSPAERRVAYAADITYCTNNELGFDYLRDNMAIYKSELVQRGHAFAIVDEVDSILIDEARTPLIISGKGEDSSKLYEMADHFVSTLRKQVFAKTDEKEIHDDYDCDYIVDEKQRTVSLTASGIAKAEKFFGVENLADAENATLSHHINQAMKARGLMKRDIDYVIKDGQVIIVDEFTGRLMYGRRYNEGLHQAIEAKEGVTVAGESKTLATITFQNFFRLYGKLSGMTGTALTEEEEFSAIYNLDVVEIPTNRPVIRIDHPDVVYKTEAGKFRAIIRQVMACHEKGQPVLVGTISIEKSEILSKLLKREGIPHSVLNAKHHEQEAQIVAQAGKLGAVTIATNMAGRGTDIMLGGNADFLAKAELARMDFPEELLQEADSYAETSDPEILKVRHTYEELLKKHKTAIAQEAEQVRAAGGLFIIGTERHESRRIDNQLRGRSGRQGDPGRSKFFLSLEDDLMRIFGSERMSVMLQRLGLPEGEALIHPWISKALEKAQQKVEERNFDIRKNLLKYDNVMNDQRKVIYEQRKELMAADDVSETIREMRQEYLADTVSAYLPHGSAPNEWQKEELKQELYRITGFMLPITNWANEPEIDADKMQEKILDEVENRIAEKNANVPENIVRMVEKNVLMQVLDQLWKEHIASLDLMRHTIVLRAYGQKDPLNEYKKEAFNMFSVMLDNLREKVTFLICRTVIQTDALDALMIQENRAQNMQEIHETPESLVGRPSAPNNYESDEKNEPFQYSRAEFDPKDPRTWGKVARNDLCPCGSGKKYKHCHGKI